MLRKQVTNHCAKVLKAIALLRLGRDEDANELIEFVMTTFTAQDATLQALTIYFKETNQRKTWEGDINFYHSDITYMRKEAVSSKIMISTVWLEFLNQTKMFQYHIVILAYVQFSNVETCLMKCWIVYETPVTEIMELHFFFNFLILVTRWLKPWIFRD